MPTPNFHQVPKVRDRVTFLYADRCRIEQDAKAIAIQDVSGITPVPCAGLALLMLGPGATITHAAVLALAENGCLVVWCGEHGVRFYGAGAGTTRNAANLLHQARLCSRRSTRLLVVRRMYSLRFDDKLPGSLTLQQIRGREGVRVRDAYARMAMETGVRWSGRSHTQGSWAGQDPVNRALSVANSCLYGVCHAAIVAAGYSPGLGFIHTGKQLSFVYDIADLYKVEVSIPTAFETAASKTKNLERETRRTCRDHFARSRILERIVHDIDYVLQVPPVPEDDPGYDEEFGAEVPGELWESTGDSTDQPPKKTSPGSRATPDEEPER